MMRKSTAFARSRRRLCSQRACIWSYMACALYTFGTLSLPLSFAIQHEQTPAVQAWFEEETLTLTRTEASGTLHFTVQIPPGHHGYLDRGDDGLLIPLTFSFAPFVQQGIQVEMYAQPGGRRDEKFRATVLRGTGTFTFGFRAISDALPQERMLPATLLYQICNDVTEVCYPPKEIEVPLRVLQQ